MIRYYGRLMMGLLMDESARRSYDADREDLRGRLPRNRHGSVSPALSRHEGAISAVADPVATERSGGVKVK